MNTERIKEIQQETAFPESISVQQALLKVWNECEQEKAVKHNAVLPIVSNRIFTVVDQDGDLINCWKNKEDAEKHAEELRKEHGAYFEATEEPLF